MNTFKYIDLFSDEDNYEALQACIDYIKRCTVKKSNDAVLQPRYCVSCGAALKNGSHRCDYCDTEYQ